MKEKIAELSENFFKQLQDVYKANGQNLNNLYIITEDNMNLSDEFRKIIEQEKSKRLTTDNEERCVYIPGVGVICF